MKAIVTVLIIGLFHIIPMNSQVFLNKSTPLSKVRQNSKDASLQSVNIELNGLSDISTLKAENIQLMNPQQLVSRVEKIKLADPNVNPIALPINTNFTINNSGKWDTLDNGDRVWRLNIKLNNGGSILVFKELLIPYGGFLHIFDKDSEMSFGPLTFNTNADGGGWMTHILPFSNIVLEYVQPLEVLGTPKIIINKVGQLITDNIDSVFNISKDNQIQSKMPQIGYPLNESDYPEVGTGVLGSPVACDDTLEAYSRSMVQYIFLNKVEENELYDSFDAKNGTLLATTNPANCKALIATVAHVAWQDSIMLKDYVAFRFNWKRIKPDTTTCCVYPKTQDWASTIDVSKIADYCGAIKRVFTPTAPSGVWADFALVEMLDYPIHNAYFSDWNAECITDTTTEVKLLIHLNAWKPLMYFKGNAVNFRCQSTDPLFYPTTLKLFKFDCYNNLAILSGSSGSGVFKKKNGIGLFDYEYIGSLESSDTFTNLNWVYDIDIPSNRPKTYLDPLNTGLSKAIGYNPVSFCQTADCCELIYTKLRPEKVTANFENICCTELVIEEKFPDDISCGDYRVIVKRRGTLDTLLNEVIDTDDIRYPNKYTHQICETLPIGFLNYKKFEYDISFIKNDTTVLSCNRTLDFTCEGCDSDDLKIELLPSRNDECCYDIKISELSENACQFKHIFFKIDGAFSPIKLSSSSSSIIGLNQDSIYIRNICVNDKNLNIEVFLYDASIELNSYGLPMTHDEARSIKSEFFDFKKIYCNCCDTIKVVSGENCGEYTITQFNVNSFYDNCGKVDSVRVDLVGNTGTLIKKNLYNQGNLKNNTINSIDLNSTYHSNVANYRFYLYDENGDLICSKDVETNCASECSNFIVQVKFPTDNDEDPCCQTIKIQNINSNYPNVTVNILKVDVTNPDNPIISSPLNILPINVIKDSQIGYFDICLTEENTFFLLEITSSSNIICTQILSFQCNGCCQTESALDINFELIENNEQCCYEMTVGIDEESCFNPTNIKVTNIEDDSIEYQGLISGLTSQEFCITDDIAKNYKIEFFDEDDYSDTSRLCIEEATIKPCFEACCDVAYIEAVKDTSIKRTLVCCWKFNVQDYNCDVYRVELYDDYTFTDMTPIFTCPTCPIEYRFSGKKSEIYEFGNTNFLPYYSEGFMPDDTLYLSGGPIDVSTLAERITSNICMDNYGDQVSHGWETREHNNVKIRLFGANGEECILEKELECVASKFCCDYVRLAANKIIDPMDTTKCCWRFGYWIENWVPSFCYGNPLKFNEISMYRDVYDTLIHKYKSDLFPLDAPNFLPYYTNTELDTLSSYTQLEFITPTICQPKGTNPTDRIILKLINANGDTCYIDALLNYCPLSGEVVPLIEYTSSLNLKERLTLDDLTLKINDLSTILDLEVNSDKIKDYELNIYDLEGRKFNLPIKSNNRNNSIDISNMSTGIYYIVLTSPNQVISKSFSIIR